MAEYPRRVLVLNHFAAPRGEAGGTRHVEMFGGLMNWEHLIIASDLNPQTGRRISGDRGFAVVRVPAYTSNGLRRVLNWAVYAWRATVVGLQEPRIDVVYGSSPHLLAAVAAWVIAALRRKPFVLEVRDLWPQVLVDMGQIRASSLTHKALTVLESFLYRRARAIVVMAEGTRAALIARGIPEVRIHYIPNGANPEDFIPSSSRDELRLRYGFDKFTAIYAGAHGPANGLDLLLDAAAEVADTDIDVVLVGGGVEKPRLLQRATSAAMTNVRFLDPMPKSEIPDILAAADAGLHVLADVPLFHTAVSPNKVFDYMAAGVPVITNCPGLVADLVRDVGCGIATEPAGLDAALRTLATDNDAGARGVRGRVWIQSHQSRTAMSRRLEALLNSARNCD